MLKLKFLIFLVVGTGWLNSGWCVRENPVQELPTGILQAAKSTILKDDRIYVSKWADRYVVQTQIGYGNFFATFKANIDKINFNSFKSENGSVEVYYTKGSGSVTCVYPAQVELLAFSDKVFAQFYIPTEVPALVYSEADCKRYGNQYKMFTIEDPFYHTALKGKVFVEDNIHLLIPNNNRHGVSWEFNVTDSGSIEHMNLFLTITNKYPYNLYISITSPGGKSVLLKRALTNDGGDNAANIAFSAALAAFKGENLNGQWSVRVVDLYNSGLGQGYLEKIRMVYTSQK